ncbi:MAG: elongation factor EF-2, partial [Promethearchaeota archaeon]
TNGHNRILLYIEPLDEPTEKLLESGKITQYMDIKERAILLREEAGWDAKEARRVVDIYMGNMLVNGATGLQRFDRIRNDLISAFRSWVGECVLAKEPAMGIKAVFTDLVVHEDPRHTQYAQTASMAFSALSLAMLDADPHLFEPIQKIDVKTPQGTEGGVLTVINKRRGQIHNVVPEGEYVRVKGQLPAAELIGIADEIRGTTQGKAFFGYEFAGFEKVPPSLEEKLILEIRKRKGMPLEMPNTKSWERFIYKKT